MVRQTWIQNLQEYWEWLEEVIRDSGGFLVNRPFIEPQAIWDDDSDGRPEDWHVLDVRNHLLLFYNGRFMKFELTVAGDLSVVEYAFHYAEVDGDLIWRACKNDHRIDQLGSETHVHISRDDIAVASAEVDLEDAIEAARRGRVPGL